MPLPKYLKDKNNPVFDQMWARFVNMDPFADLSDTEKTNDIRKLQQEWELFGSPATN